MAHRRSFTMTRSEPRMRSLWHVPRGILGSGATVIVLGCMGTPAELTRMATPEEAIGQFTASPSNAILMVGGTVQLAVAAQSLAGAPLTSLDSVAYRLGSVADSTKLRVSPTGLVTGLASSSSASLPVNVLGFWNGTWNADQILVTVTPTAVTGLALSIQPPSGDSTKLARGIIKTITPVLRNPVTGQSLTGIQLRYTVLPTETVRVGVFGGCVPINSLATAASRCGALGIAARNQIVPYVAEGGAWIYAAVNAYGTLLQDSVRYTWSYPYTGTLMMTKINLAVVTVVNSGSVATAAALVPDLTLAAGGTVAFTNGVASGDPLLIVFNFDNSAAATTATPLPNAGGTSGNVTALTAGQSSTRKFLTPGTYRWTRVASGGPSPWAGQTATGAIVIR